MVKNSANHIQNALKNIKSSAKSLHNPVENLSNKTYKQIGSDVSVRQSNVYSMDSNANALNMQKAVTEAMKMNKAEFKNLKKNFDTK